ncbi:MAG TPA: DUF2807 domain-containing protein [Anaerolineales bacterium]|nr:DUF2807 domain-containing protein [Anaerolineales bacterium]
MFGNRALPFLTLGGALLACSVLPSAAGQGVGNIETREFSLEGFQAVEACCGFEVALSGGDGYGVSVTADTNAFDSLVVDVKDGTLRLLVSPSGGSITTQTLKAEVTMPTLEGVTLDSGSSLTVGSVPPEGSQVSLEAGGGSHADLTAMTIGHAQVRLTAGASAEVRVDGILDYELSGGAHLDYYGDPDLGVATSSGGASATAR